MKGNWIRELVSSDDELIFHNVGQIGIYNTFAARHSFIMNISRVLVVKYQYCIFVIVIILCEEQMDALPS